LEELYRAGKQQQMETSADDKDDLARHDDFSRLRPRTIDLAAGSSDMGPSVASHSGHGSGAGSGPGVDGTGGVA